MLSFLIFFWFFSLALGQFANLYANVYGGIYLFDILAFIFVIYSALYFLIAKKIHLIIPKIYFYFFAFCLWNIVSLILAFQYHDVVEMAYALFYFLRLFLYLLGGLFIYSALKAHLISEVTLRKILVFFTLSLCVSGFIQLLIFPNFSLLDPSLGWDPHINRLLGSLFDPNFMGATLVLCFNIFLSNYSRKDNKSYIVIFITLLAIFLTFSRSAWLMLAASIFVFGIFKYRSLLFISLIIAFFAYFAVPRVQTRIASVTDPADSAHFRLISWKNTLNIAEDHLFFGTGYNTFRFVQKEYGFFGVDSGGHSGGGADSSLLLTLATTGIPGIFLFLGFFLTPIKMALKAKNMQSSWKLALLASFPALLVNSFFINSLFYPQILFLWNLILAGFIFSYTEP
jgi:O-antigen ligase